jgi:hypothetical protein
MADTYQGRDVPGRLPGCTCRSHTIIGGGHHVKCSHAPDLSGCQRYSDGDFSVYVRPADPSFVYLGCYPGQDSSAEIIYRLAAADGM